jgi:hypothetical protein
MERGPAHSDAVAGREARFDRLGTLAKPDSMEFVAGGRGDLNAECLGRGQAIRHNAFSAGFINRSNGGIGHQNFKTAAAGGDRSSETGRAPAHDEDVRGRR